MSVGKYSRSELAPPPLDHTQRIGSATVTRVGWIPQEEIDLHAWVTLGKRLGQMGRAVQWWIGDWLGYGSARWGEKYADAAKITGYDPRSLRNMACLANEFDLSRRRDKLTWSHHAAVAGLAEQDQERWLNRAEHEKLSVADLRLALRASQRNPEMPPAKRKIPAIEAQAITHDPEGAGAAAGTIGDGPTFPEDKTDKVVCPACGHVYR